MSVNLKFECYIAIVVGLVSGKAIRFNENIDSQKTLFHNRCLLGGEGAVTCSKVFLPKKWLRVTIFRVGKSRNCHI
jgi:hypothetical protein